MTLKPPVGANTPTIEAVTTALGNITGAATLTTSGTSETWATATLTGNTTLTLSGLTIGHVVRLIVSQDSTGSRTFEVTDGIVSQTADIDERAGSTTVINIYRTATDELTVAGAGVTRPPRSLTADYSVIAADENRALVFTTSSTATLTVPSGTFNSGSVVSVYQLGAGTVEIQGEAGVAILSSSTGRLLSRGAEAKLTNIATNIWVLTGTLTATTSYDPSGVANLVSWLKADAITGKADGDPMTTWEDSYSSNKDAVQATTASKPTYKLGGRNGLPSVRFDGSDDLMAITGLTTATARTIIIAAARTAAPGHDAFVWNLSQSGSGLRDVAGIWKYNRDQSDVQISFVGSVGSTSVVTVKFTDASNAAGYFNSGTAVAFDPKDVYNVGTLTLGAQDNGDAAWLGDICEVLVYDAALNNTDRANIETYLMAKWGV